MYLNYAPLNRIIVLLRKGCVYMLIGIDGGGTKTALVLADICGRVLFTVKGPGTNISDIGLDECENRLRDQLSRLLADYGGPSAKVDSVYAGIAGSSVKSTRESLGRMLRRLLPNGRIIDNHTDAFNPLYGEAEEGIVLIAGTGSSAFVVKKQGAIQVGGWGYLIDDAGSGFRVGADALKAAFRSFDGRGPKTMLEELISCKLNMPINEAIPTIYGGGKSFVASFVPVVFDAMEAGDSIARSIILNAADELALHLSVCLKHIQTRPATAIVNGGLTGNKVFLSMLRSAMGNEIDCVNIVRPELSPVYGALAKAARNAGIIITTDFRNNYINTCKGV